MPVRRTHLGRQWRNPYLDLSCVGERRRSRSGGPSASRPTRAYGAKSVYPAFLLAPSRSSHTSWPHLHSNARAFRPVFGSTALRINVTIAPQRGQFGLLRGIAISTLASKEAFLRSRNQQSRASQRVLAAPALRENLHGGLPVSRRRRISSLFTHCRATSFHKHLREVTIAQAMSTRRKPALWRHGAYRPCSGQCCLHEVLQLRSP